jgi:hypothetical protein
MKDSEAIEILTNLLIKKGIITPSEIVQEFRNIRKLEKEIEEDEKFLSDLKDWADDV